jgi:hypothetical protein
MAVAFIFSSDQIGQAEYDGLMQALGREALDVPTPAGSLAHLSGPKPGGGWQVIDVWDSEESANAFYGSAEFSAVTTNADSMGITITPWPMHRVQLAEVVHQLD